MRAHKRRIMSYTIRRGVRYCTLLFVFVHFLEFGIDDLFIRSRAVIAGSGLGSGWA